jgi:polar amino acid transport system ATP-binding protein
MVIVSHEMNFVKACANKIIFLDGGKISFMGTVEETFNNKENQRLKEFLEKTNK